MSAGPAGRLLLWTIAGTATKALIDSLAIACPGRFAFHAPLKELSAAPIDEQLGAALPNGHGVVVYAVDGSASAPHLEVAQACAGMGLRHLLLCHRDPFDGMVAQWHDSGDSSVKEMKRIVRQAAATHVRFNQVLEALRLTDQPRRMVSVEALSSGSAEGLSAFWAWIDLLEFLDIEPTDSARLQALQGRFAKAVAKGPAGAASTAPNLNALRREMAWLPGPWITRSSVRVRFVAAAPPGGSARQVRLQSPPLLCEPDSIWPVEGSLQAPGKDNGSSAVALSVDRAPAIGPMTGSHDEPNATYLRSERTPAGGAVIAFRGLGRRIRAGDRWRFTYRPSDAPGETVGTVLFELHPKPPIAGIFLAPWSLGYQPIPKVACTSIKLALFKLATGEEASESNLAGAKHIHDYFITRTQDVSGAAFKFIVIRDPVARFVSGYVNRVNQHRELSETYLRSLPISLQLPLHDFVFDPTLSQFIDRFDLYMRVPTIHHHFQLVADQVLSLAAFDKVYPVETIAALCTDVAQVTGHPFAVPREQGSSSKKHTNELSDAQRSAIVRICERDYDMLKAYYTPDGRLHKGGA